MHAAGFIHAQIARSGLEETPIPTPTVDPEQVTPGVGGLLVIVLLVIATVVLALDMLRRVRRARYREEANLALDSEEAAAREAESAGPVGEAEPEGSSAPDGGTPSGR